MLETEESSSEKLPPGHIISNRYEIVKRLGAGGMGAVYLAKDRVLEDGTVAMKVLHPQMGNDGDLAKRFLREVALMNKVNHPNVVRTFDVGRDNELIYFTMEFVSGTSLDSLVRKTSFEIAQVINFIQQICQALQAIHAADIVHRDLKPANIILLPDKTLKLTDFGVARAKGSNLTQHDEIIGSVEYMAPEIWLGKELSAATDFYSLGVILYEIATGKLPFEADQPAAMMFLHVKRPPNPPKSLRPEIPNWLNQLILKLLAKNPDERPKTAGEILQFVSSHAQRQGLSQTGSFPTIGSSQATASGSFPIIGSNSAQVQSTGSFPATNSGSFPQVTAGVRRTNSKSLKEKRLQQHRRLVYIGVGLICSVIINMKWLLAFYQDFFPY